MVGLGILVACRYKFSFEEGSGEVFLLGRINERGHDEEDIKKRESRAQ